MKIGGKNINGMDTEVHANTDGVFQIWLDGKVIGSGENLTTAIAQARNTINRDKTVVAVEFITMDGGEKGVATGFHSGTRSTLARIADGRSEQLQASYKAFNPDMPLAKTQRWFKIRDDINALKAEQRQLEEEFGIILRDAVQQAITEAQSKTLSGVTARAAGRRASASPQRRRRY